MFSIQIFIFFYLSSKERIYSFCVLILTFQFYLSLLGLSQIPGKHSMRNSFVSLMYFQILSFVLKTVSRFFKPIR